MFLVTDAFRLVLSSTITQRPRMLDCSCDRRFPLGDVKHNYSAQLSAWGCQAFLATAAIVFVLFRASVFPQPLHTLSFCV